MRISAIYVQGRCAQAVSAGIPPATPGKFFSALWDDGNGYDTALALSFGTDCTVSSNDAGTLCTSPSALHTKVGWDNLTGVGTPNGQTFKDSFNPLTSTAKRGRNGSI
jgi:hypothetical protein